MSRAARALHWRNQRAVTIIERYWWKFFGGNRFNRSGLNRAKVVTRVGLESSSTGSSFPAVFTKPVPLAVVSLDSR
ncbi:tRNA pseudouridine synthase [Dirofilaria immitis]